MEAFPTKVPDFVTLEHDVATILTNQELHGWYFDEPAARELASTLYTELDGLTRVLRERHPFVAGSVFNPKRPNKTQGYFVGAESVRLKDANFTSRDHIAWIMQTFYDWKPTQFTDKGKATIDEVVLKEIGTPIALQFFRCLELTKQLGMLAEGNNAWLKLVKDGRIHHNCSVATNTHRCAHRKPNLAQVPSDHEFRKLFTATPSMVMVGADLAGIELRMLAHYLARYDQGRYADILLNGDIHQENADKIGISRQLTKTVTYAFLYGAGDEKIGLSYDAQLPKNKAREKGKEIRAAYVAAIDGLDKLLAAVRTAGERGFVKTIDGRRIAVDSVHKALNYLLQSSAGVIAKRWMTLAADAPGRQLAFIHDELQWETTPELAEDLKFKLELSAVMAGEYYKLRIPIAAEGKIGSTWADVH
jgi:DNA polymerase I-like protein with 3'-5' exonuclease and polymerase domains